MTTIPAQGDPKRAAALRAAARQAATRAAHNAYEATTGSYPQSGNPERRQEAYDAAILAFDDTYSLHGASDADIGSNYKQHRRAAAIGASHAAATAEQHRASYPHCGSPPRRTDPTIDALRAAARETSAAAYNATTATQRAKEQLERRQRDEAAAYDAADEARAAFEQAIDGGAARRADLAAAQAYDAAYTAHRHFPSATSEQQRDDARVAATAAYDDARRAYRLYPEETPA